MPRPFKNKIKIKISFIKFIKLILINTLIQYEYLNKK